LYLQTAASYFHLLTLGIYLHTPFLQHTYILFVTTPLTSRHHSPALLVGIYFRLNHQILHHSSLHITLLHPHQHTSQRISPPLSRSTMDFPGDNYFTAESNNMGVPACQSCNYTFCQCGIVSPLLQLNLRLS
jgi:hypothetical protein